MIRSFERKSIGGFVHEPESPSRGGLALTHGAGANCNSRLLIAVADAFSAHGWTVVRYDLPFRRTRPFGPPFPKSAEADQAGIREAVEHLRSLTTGPLITGGHSYGGRQTTMLAAKEPALCDALIAFSYPLHPPKKPEQLRTAHFPQLTVPALFVHGSADPFGTIDEMRKAIAAIPARTKLVKVESAGHDLKNGKIDLEALVISELGALFS